MLHPRVCVCVCGGGVFLRVCYPSRGSACFRLGSMLSVYVNGLNKVTGLRFKGKLHLVDLAGSERLSKSGATGDRMEEAKNING